MSNLARWLVAHAFLYREKELPPIMVLRLRQEAAYIIAGFNRTELPYRKEK